MGCDMRYEISDRVENINSATYVKIGDEIAIDLIY